MDKITVVTVTYNCEEIISKTLESCCHQDYENMEYIIIDGTSKDKTLDIIKTYSEKISLLISEPDKGIYDAMNKGIDAASGEWIFFLNAGDVFYSDNTLSKIFTGNLNDVDAVLGNYYSTDKDGINFHKVERPFYQKNHLYLSMGFNHQCIFVRTKWAKHLMFDLSFKCCADYNMLYTMYQKGARFLYVNVPVSIIEGRYGFSQSHVKIQRYEEAKIRGLEKTFKFKLYDLYKCCRMAIKKLIVKNTNLLL